MPDFELVVPAYNEEENLPSLVSRTVLASQYAGFSPGSFQLVIVNNGSTDGSAGVLRELKSGPNSAYFRVVTVPKNLGYGHGILHGLDSTTARVVGWTHADLQCDPADAFKAFEILKMSTEKALVKGTRTGRNWKDQWVTRCFEFLAHFILGMKLSELNAQPKVFNRALLSELRNPPLGISFDLYVLYTALKRNYDVKTFLVQLPPRVHGSSKWAFHFASRYKTIARVLMDVIAISHQEGRL